MIAFLPRRGNSISSSNPRNYRIHLRIAPADREDAWEICRVVLHYGGVEVSDCCFAFANADRWHMALEALRLQFGPEYFEAVEPASLI